MSDNRTPVVFIHGLWLHASSWTPWEELFTAHGYRTLAPGWPGEPDTVEGAREHPEAVADRGIEEVTQHFAEIVSSSTSLRCSSVTRSAD